MDAWQARSLSLDLLLDWRQRWVASRKMQVVRLGLFQVLPEFQFCLGPASGPGRLPRGDRASAFVFPTSF